MNGTILQAKPWQFTTADSTDELNNKLAIFNTMKTYTEEDVLLMVDCLANLGVNTYKFSYCANEISPNLTTEALEVLNRDLDTVRQSLPPELSAEKRKKFFCELYILTYRHFRDEQIEEMGSLLQSYSYYFKAPPYEKETALIYQVEGRYYRSKGDLDAAITNDKKAISLLEKQKIDNVQVQITYAGTILRALQNTGDASYLEKVKDVVPKVEHAIEIYPMVSRYYYLLAKLYLYTLLYDSQISPDEYSDIVQKARKLIDQAIDKENPNFNAYVKNVSKYNGMRQVAEFILVQRKFIDQTTNSLREKMESSEVTIKDTLRSTQNRYLETMGLFVSIIAIIMAFIQSFSGDYSVFEMVSIIVAMNAGLLAVYAAFLILLREFQSKYAWTIIICIALIITVLVCTKTSLSDQSISPNDHTTTSSQTDATAIQSIDSTLSLDESAVYSNTIPSSQ